MGKSKEHIYFDHNQQKKILKNNSNDFRENKNMRETFT